MKNCLWSADSLAASSSFLLIPAAVDDGFAADLLSFLAFNLDEELDVKRSNIALISYYY